MAQAIRTAQVIRSVQLIFPWGLQPDSLFNNNLTLTNEHGSSTRWWGVTKKAWFGYLPEGVVNWLSVDTVEHVTNIAYEIWFDNIKTSGESFLLVGHKFHQRPNMISLVKDQEPQNVSTAPAELPVYENSVNGDFSISDNSDGFTEFVFAVSNKDEGHVLPGPGPDDLNPYTAPGVNPNEGNRTMFLKVVHVIG